MTDTETISKLLLHDVCTGNDCDSCEFGQDNDACYQHLLLKTAEYLIENNVVIQKTGDWKQGTDYTGYVCSACNNWSRYDTSFCPECGAKMNNS